MPEDPYDLEDQDLDPDEVDENELIRKLRSELKERSKAEKESAAELAALRKKDAIRDSGLDLTNPVHQFFADKAEFTDADDLKAKALEIGILTTPDPQVADAEVAQHAASAAIAAGAEGGGGGVDPDIAFQQEAAELGRFGSPEKVAALIEKHYGADAVNRDG